MKAVQIRRLLIRKGATMTAAERAVLAVLEYEPKLDRINADYDKARKIERTIIVRRMESAWIEGKKKGGRRSAVSKQRRTQRNGR